MNFLEKIGLRKKQEDINPKAIKRETNYGVFGPAPFSSKKEVIIIPWNSPEGRKMLVESQYNSAFFFLAHTFQNMRNPFYGSIASMVNVLNAMRLDRGVIPDNKERSVKLFDRDTGDIREFTLNIYSQTTLLDAETDRIKHRDKIAPKIESEVAYVDFEEFNPGLSLLQVKEILELYKCNVDLIYANNEVNIEVSVLIEKLKKSLSSNEEFIIANFYGEYIGLHQLGHYSVIGAYHEDTKSVLILDPAAHKTPWYWVSVKQLYHAMNTEAREGNKRGYIVVKDSI